MAHAELKSLPWSQFRPQSGQSLQHLDDPVGVASPRPGRRRLRRRPYRANDRTRGANARACVILAKARTKSCPARSDRGGGNLSSPKAPQLKACAQPPKGQAPSAQLPSQSSEARDRSNNGEPQGKKPDARALGACTRKAICLATGPGALRAQPRARPAESRTRRRTLLALPSQASKPCDRAGELACKPRRLATGNRRFTRRRCDACASFGRLLQTGGRVGFLIKSTLALFSSGNLSCSSN